METEEVSAISTGNNKFGSIRRSTWIESFDIMLNIGTALNPITASSDLLTR